MNNIIIFDVDGTLVESSKIISDENALILNKLKNKFKIGVCGGGTLEKILYQLNNKIQFDYYFSECGCVLYKLINNKLNHIYTKNIRTHHLYPKINLLIKDCLAFFSQVNYTLTGHFIDLRNGLIYISCIGMQANDEEREYFKAIDEKESIRQNLLLILQTKAEEYKIDDQIRITFGGSVGIAIYPKEYDKVQILDDLTVSYEKIIYFGDRYLENGNDNLIINDSRVTGHKINSIEETFNILKSYLD